MAKSKGIQTALLKAKVTCYPKERFPGYEHYGLAQASANKSGQIVSVYQDSDGSPCCTVLTEDGQMHEVYPSCIRIDELATD